MKLKNIYIMIFVITSITSIAQKNKIKWANKEYNQYAYIDAIKIYENVAKKGYKDIEMFKKLGNAYYFNAELNKAEKWYEELFAMTQEVEPEYYYRYSQTLKSIEKYEKADQMLHLFNKKNGNDSRGKNYKKKENYLQIIEENSGRYITENAGINSVDSDYGSSFYGNQLIFASSRIIKGTNKRIQEWNNQAFTSLYASTIDSEGNLLSPEKFSPNIDSKFNEATPVFTNDGKTMYFTRNNYNEGKKKWDDNRTTLLKLYKATFKDGKFTDVSELPFNSDQFSNAHPALSIDEKTLYFASDRPGSIGQSDLYKVAINTDGTFGTPINLGPTINTEGKETFPFISNENELYFSSDGHPGLGGLDIYVSKIKDTFFEEVINIGKPINGPMDDFAFFIDTKSRIGFFSSNRANGLGYDDIYKFKETKKIAYEQLLTGIVIDEQTEKVLLEAKVTLFDKNMKVINETYTNEKGEYIFDNVKYTNTYFVRVEKINYHTIEKSITIAKKSGNTELIIALDPMIKPIKIGDDLAKIFKIKNIYFDLDKWNIRTDAAFDLATLVEVMKENPTIKIDVRSHTDSRQSHEYNEVLSDRRAKSTIAWMIAQGIETNRLTGKGYGESQLINKCSDNVECPDEEHQQNRRSEFIILKM